MIPVVIYFGIFVYFEPYNYFGIKESEYTADSAIVRVRNYNAEPADVLSSATQSSPTLIWKRWKALWAKRLAS